MNYLKMKVNEENPVVGELNGMIANFRNQRELGQKLNEKTNKEMRGRMESRGIMTKRRVAVVVKRVFQDG